MDNKNLNWAYKIQETLYSMGVRHVCICPGARNTALTIAFTNKSKVNATSHIDERSAGYFALGLSKKTIIPTVIITTSGTAVANLLPSIIESSYSKTPVIVLSADRPKNHIGIGVNQAISQQNIFGDNVRGNFDIGLPRNNYAILTDTLLNAYKKSMGTIDIPPGPVHINAPFNEPIVENVYENADKDIFPTKSKKMLKYKINSDKIDFSKSIIVCGEIHPTESLDSIIELSEYVNAPIFADPTSNLRFYKKHPNIIANYNYIIDRVHDIPSSIIRFGRKPTSKVLNNFINNHDDVFLIDRYPRFNNSSKYYIKSDYITFLDYVRSNYKSNNNNVIFDIFTKYQIKISSVIKNTATKDSNCEGLFINNLLSNINPNSNIFIGNSMCIREADDLAQNCEKNHKIYCNRGASGIDGLVSTAIGMTYDSLDTLNIAIIGDLSLFHDMNGLHFTVNNEINTKFIVINNNGGGIFTTLNINGLNYSRFKEFWTTPLNLSLEIIAKLYNIEYIKVKNSDDALLAINKNNKPMIIEYKVDVNETQEVKKNLYSKINSIKE